MKGAFALALVAATALVVPSPCSSSPRRDVRRFESPRERAQRRQAVKEAAARAEEEANARTRLAFEYAKYKQTKNFAGESLEAFAARRANVGTTPRRVGYGALALVFLLNVKLALAPAEIKAVATDPNGICVAARGDRLRPGQERLNSNGTPCMKFADFARQLLL